MVQIVFVREKRNSDKEKVVKEKFFDKKEFFNMKRFFCWEVLTNKNLTNRKSAFDFILLLF